MANNDSCTSSTDQTSQPDKSKLPAKKYALALRLLHWLTVALLALMLYWGFSLQQAGDQQFATLKNHVLLGLCLGLLTLIRLFVKGLTESPPKQSGLPADFSRLVHAGLYLLLLLTPVSGYFLLTEAAGSLQDVFFTTKQPSLPADLLQSGLFKLHHYLVWSLIVLLILHLLAVLKHLLIDRDAVLKRMI